MDIGVIITAAVTVLVVVLGFIFEKERDRKAKLHERKEELYRQLVYSLKGFFEEQPDPESKQKFVEETRLARLYASDESIRSLNKFLDLMYQSAKDFEDKTGGNYQKTAHNLIGIWMRAMRKDLGINTKLSSEELGRTEMVKKQ